MKDDKIIERKHECCTLCGVDAEVAYVDQDTGYCMACTNGVWL